MGPVRNKTGRVRYDPELPENWTINRLKEELRNRNVTFPINARRMFLVRLLRSSNISVPTERNATNNVEPVSTHADALLGSARSQHASLQNNNGRDERDKTLTEIVSMLTNTVHTLQQNVTNLTSKVNNLVTNSYSVGPSSVRGHTSSNENNLADSVSNSARQPSEDSISSFTLDTAFRAFNSPDNRPHQFPSAAAGSEEQARTFTRTARGYSAESLPFVESISPQIRKNIIQDDQVPEDGPGSRFIGNTLPATINVVDELNEQVEELWDASLSENTKHVYKTGISCFLNFLIMSRLVDNCTVQGHLYPQISEDHLILFVTHCKNVLKLQHDTIRLYLAGVRYHYVRRNNVDPLSSQSRLNYILRGVKKTQINKSIDRLPITASVLKQLCMILAKGVFSPFLDSMLQCVFKMAFFGFMRCGEFTLSDSSGSFLTLGDVQISPSAEYYSIYLLSSKCDPFHKGVQIKIFENSTLKPVQTMSDYLQSRFQSGAVFSSPLFVENEFNFSPLNRTTFISYLKDLLDRLGYDVSRYSGHSFRIGAATSAAMAGIEDHIIQSLGRWRSDSYIRYIRIDQKIIAMAQNDMSFQA